MKMFNLETDVPLLDEIYKSRGMEIDFDVLPTIGFINQNAACFLITTNTDYCCFLEFLISRKGCFPSDVDQVMDACLNYAKEAGYKKVFGLSSSIRGIKRAKLKGFNITDQKVLLWREL